MPSSYTPRLRLEMQAAGENLNTWGAPKLNQVISRLDFAIAGRTLINLAGVSSYTLVSSNGDDEARAAILDIIGAAGPCTVTLPASSKTYLVRNQSAATVTFTTGAGNSAAVPPGAVTELVCDGAQVCQLGFGGLGLKEYIDQAALAATGSLPATTGNAGKTLYCDGTVWAPRTPTLTDFTDLPAYTAQRNAFALVMSLIF